jgi:tetratricopeptide (TPR) repeat protein
MSDLLKHLGIRIQEAVEEKDWAGVEHWSKELLKYAPQKTLGFKWMARASMAQGKFDRAAYAYNRVLDFEPDNEEAKKFFAEHMRSDLKTTQSSVQSMEVAETDENFHLLSPEQKTFLGRAEFEAATAYESVKMYAEAAAHFQKSFFWFSHPQAAFKAAEMFHKGQKSYEAMKLLRETLNANPNWVEGHLLAGQIYFELGQLSSAQNEWQSVLKLEPRNSEALARLRSTWDLEHR